MKSVIMMFRNIGFGVYKYHIFDKFTEKGIYFRVCVIIDMKSCYGTLVDYPYRCTTILHFLRFPEASSFQSIMFSYKWQPLHGAFATILDGLYYFHS